MHILRCGLTGDFVQIISGGSGDSSTPIKCGFHSKYSTLNIIQGTSHLTEVEKIEKPLTGL